MLFARAGHPGSVHVKPVVGLPGDRVATRSGALILDDRPVPDEADGAVTVDDPGNGPTTARAHVEGLPSGASYRIARLDEGAGRPDMEPLTVEPGTLFVLGDNRDASLDSRHGEFGTVRAADLVASGGTFIWSRAPGRMLAGVR